MQIISVVVPIITYIIDLLFIKNEILINDRAVSGNPMSTLILIIAIICIILAIVPLVKHTGKPWMSWLGIILSILLIIVSVY